MLMFSLLELLNAQRTREKRDSFQFSQSGHLQVHAFDKGSPPSQNRRGETDAWLTLPLPFFPLTLGMDGGSFEEEGRMGMRRGRETGHEDTSHEYFSWGTDCKNLIKIESMLLNPSFFIYIYVVGCC